MGGGVGEALRHRHHRLVEGSPPGLLGRPQGLGAPGGDDIRHPLRLGQIQLAV